MSKVDPLVCPAGDDDRYIRAAAVRTDDCVRFRWRTTTLFISQMSPYPRHKWDDADRRLFGSWRPQQVSASRTPSKSWDGPIAARMVAAELEVARPRDRAGV